MNIFESIFLGSIQGITEFLPISSSGHLWLAQYFLGITEPKLLIEISLHFATLLAVLVYFWKDILSLLKNFFLPSGDKEEKSLAWKLLLTTAITGTIGILTKDFFSENITPHIIAITLFITAGFVLFSEYCAPKINKSFSWTFAALLGFVQAIALFPGISRSGITIAFLLMVGIARTQSVRISFLVSIPTILGASLLLLKDFEDSSINLIPLFVSGIVAFVVAYATIWGMMKHLDKIWKWCALWCIFVGGSILIWSFLG